MKDFRQQKRTTGFTLMETLLAVALIGVLVSVFITVFVPARGMLQKALSKQDADRLVSILRAELNTLHPSERSESDSSGVFGKGFRWMTASRNPSTSIVIFSYYADFTRGRREDDTYPAVSARSAAGGKNTQLVTIACPMNSTIHQDDIRHAVGPVYLVKLTHLEKEDDAYYRLATTPGTISGSDTPENYYSTDKDDPWGAVVFCRADFYIMSKPNPARYKGRTWSRVGRPVFSTNISFRR